MKETQHDRIINYLKTFGSITPMEAFMDLGITKLATRVSEMRRLGIEFDQKMEESTNRYGEIVRYMRYSLPKDSGCNMRAGV